MGGVRHCTHRSGWRWVPLSLDDPDLLAVATVFAPRLPASHIQEQPASSAWAATTCVPGNGMIGFPRCPPAARRVPFTANGITPDDYNRGGCRSRRSDSARSSNLSPLQRRALIALANDGERLYAGEVRQRFQLGDSSAHQKALQRLTELELVESVQRGTYRVPDLFLREWLTQTS